MLVTGIYGGYFGAAQGIMLLAHPRLASHDDLQRLNAIKNVLAGLVNFVAAVVFIVVAHVAWGAAALIAGGSMVGGQLGARYGRRLPPAALRARDRGVGVFAIVRLLVDSSRRVFTRKGSDHGRDRTVEFKSAAGERPGLSGASRLPGRGRRAPGRRRHPGVVRAGAPRRGRRRRLAGEGYVALAPDLYHGQTTVEDEEARHLMEGLDWGGGAAAELAGAVRHLREGGGPPASESSGSAWGARSP